MDKLEKLKDYLEYRINLDFDFNVEHWENGNFDDSYGCGVDCGTQYTLKEILDKVKELINE